MTVIKYKDSGEFWMGQIPEHWDLLKLEHIFHEKKIKHNPELGAGSISFGEVIRKADNSIPESTKASYQEVLKDEFLINPLNLNYDLKSLRIALSEIDVVVSSGYIVIKDHQKIDRRFYKYLLHRYDVDYMKLLGSGVRQTINFNHISSSILAYPPIEEQTNIANFLDKKSAEIKRFMELKEKTIELLKERKTAIINQAVTKGLDPNVEMKDSGIEWLGEIPAHWHVKKAKFAFNKLSRPTKKEYDVVTAFRDGEVTLRTNRRTEGFTNSTQFHGYQGVCPGDFVIHGMDGFAGAIGVSDSEGHCSPVYSICSYRDYVNPYFYKHFLRVCAKRGHIESLSKGIRERSSEFRFNVFAELELVFLEPDEQSEIVEFIESSITIVDQQIDKTLHEIQLIKEYQESLINESVTGKIDVRNYKAET